MRAGRSWLEKCASESVAAAAAAANNLRLMFSPGVKAFLLYLLWTSVRLFSFWKSIVFVQFRTDVLSLGACGLTAHRDLCT